jgi:cystathionine beta-lyase
VTDRPRWLSLDQLRSRRSYKWRAHPPDVIPAFVAEMDVTLATPVARALRESIARGDTGYASPGAELGEAVVAFHRQRFDWQPEPAAIHLIPDVMAGVCELLRRVVPPGSSVVVNCPVYPPFYSHIAEAGCRVVEAPLARDGAGYSLDIDALAVAFSSGAGAFMLCSPHNPTGLVLSQGELRAVALLAERFGVLVLADEIHAPLTLPGERHVPYLSLPEARAHGISFVSATKAWNLPGLKCAQVVTASDAMAALVAHLPEDMPWRAGNLGVTASIAAYREGGPWLDELLRLLDHNRRLLGELLVRNLPAVGYAPPSATYLAWLDCTRLELGANPAAAFLERGRVALRPGPDFGSGGEGWVRMTIATHPEILAEIVLRMGTSIG